MERKIHKTIATVVGLDGLRMIAKAYGAKCSSIEFSGEAENLSCVVTVRYEGGFESTTVAMRDALSESQGLSRVWKAAPGPMLGAVTLRKALEGFIRTRQKEGMTSVHRV